MICTNLWCANKMNLNLKKKSESVKEVGNILMVSTMTLTSPIYWTFPLVKLILKTQMFLSQIFYQNKEQAKYPKHHKWSSMTLCLSCSDDGCRSRTGVGWDWEEQISNTLTNLLESVEVYFCKIILSMKLHIN
jgi:hypothetical protein